MPGVFLRKELYDEVVRRGYDTKKFVEEAVKEELERLKKEEEEKKSEGT